MSINFSLGYEEGFCNLYNRYLTMDSGVKLLELEGISPDKFDRHIQSKKYHNENVADVTVDSNANACSGKSPLNFKGEIGKAFDKLDGMYLLWKTGKDMYGEDTASMLIESVINGDLYFHDPTQVDIPYCFAASFSNLMTQGRPWANPRGLPPKKLKSFISQVAETVMDMSQEFAGAIAIADVIACMVYYVRKEKTTDYEIRDAFQSLVHIVNNKFRVSGQSPFTNISLFDEECFNQLFSEMTFPDGSHPTFEEFNRLQKIYGEWYSKGDPSTGLPYTFPVTTLNSYVENGKPKDLDTFNWYMKINLEKATFNFYLTSEKGKLASCCRLVNDLNLMAGINSAFGNGGKLFMPHNIVIY